MAYPRLDSHGLSTMLTRLASVIRQGHTIKSDDATMTQRKNLKIIGATVTDNALADQTELTIPNGGHTIISSSMLPIGGSTLPMAGRDNLQFGSEYDPVFTEDDSTNNKTIVHGQLFICDSESDWNTLSDADFKAKYGADREQVGVYWYRPWANSIAYQTDLTPVGTVLSLAVDATNTTIFPADLVEFPNKDYLICRGATVKITDYPLLYDYFEAEYGDGNYFGNSQTAEGYFVLPNWSADFPTNGVLVIKARVTSDVITFAEVDDTAVTSENVWSAEKTDAEIDALATDIDKLKTSSGVSHQSITNFTSTSVVIERRVGNICIVTFTLKASTTIAASSNYQDILTLTYKPKYSARCNFITVVSSISSAKSIVLQANTTGKLQWYSGASSGWTTSDDIRGQLVYEINDA